MIRESMLELAEAAAPELRPIVLNACLESALLRSFHDSSVFFYLCMTGQSARRYGSGQAGLCSSQPSGWGELSFRLMDKKGYYPERWLFKAQRYLKFMGIETRIGFTRKATTHVGWIRAPGLASAAERIGAAAGQNGTAAARIGAAAGQRVAATAQDPKSPSASPPGVRFVIDIQASPDKAAVRGRVVLIEGWGECFSLRLED